MVTNRGQSVHYCAALWRSFSGEFWKIKNLRNRISTYVFDDTVQYQTVYYRVLGLKNARTVQAGQTDFAPKQKAFCIFNRVIFHEARCFVYFTKFRTSNFSKVLNALCVLLNDIHKVIISSSSRLMMLIDNNIICDIINCVLRIKHLHNLVPYFIRISY